MYVLQLEVSKIYVLQCQNIPDSNLISYPFAIFERNYKIFITKRIIVIKINVSVAVEISCYFRKELSNVVLY